MLHNSGRWSSDLKCFEKLRSVLFFVLFTPLKSICSLLQFSFYSLCPQHYTFFLHNLISKIIYTVPCTSFQPENIKSLCQTVPKLIYDLGLVDTDVHLVSIKLCTKYLQLFARSYSTMEKLKDLVRNNLYFMLISVWHHSFCLSICTLTSSTMHIDIINYAH